MTDAIVQPASDQPVTSAAGAGELTDMEIREIAAAEYFPGTGDMGRDTIRAFRAVIAADRARCGRPTSPPAEALSARPLLEKVAAMGERIGQHTVGEIMAISDRAAAWLRQNPPGQPVAIEPRGCPIPGACTVNGT